MAGKGINVAVSAKDRLAARNDLAWAISVGGIGVVGFAALLLSPGIRRDAVSDLLPECCSVSRSTP